MKKFVTVSLITAGILAAVGIILVLISSFWEWGGDFLLNDDKSLKSRLEKVDETLEKVGDELEYRTYHDGLPLIRKDSDLVISDEKGKDSSSMVQEQEFNVDNIRNLDLTLGAGELYLREKDVSDGPIRIRWEGKGECSQYVKDDTLYVEGFRRGSLAGDRLDKVIIIEVPKDMRFHEVEIEAGAGVMEIPSLKTEELEAVIGAGALNISNLDALEFSAKIGAGRLSAENISVRDADIEVGMGECTYTGTILKELEAECDMGNMEFHLTGRKEDHNYEIKCALGNITLADASFSAIAGERIINNHAPGTFEITCNMGNVSVLFEE